MMLICTNASYVLPIAVDSRHAPRNFGLQFRKLVGIKSITDLGVFSFVGSRKANYSSTELNFGRLRERGGCIGCDLLDSRLLSRSPRLRLALALEIEDHCSADEILQGRPIDLVAFMNVDGAPDISVEAGVE
jgi:hypothetical protein